MPETIDFLAAGFSSISEAHNFSSWFANLPSVQKQASIPKLANSKATQLQTAARSRPSDAGHGMLLGSALFSELGGLTLGTDVHQLLSEIEWWPYTLPTHASPLARELVANFLQHAEAREIFERPASDAIVWRERSIACRLDDMIVSAQMDRVIIQPPQNSHSKGKILLVDFKTDKGEPREIVKRYLFQMQAYIKILEAWSQGKYEICAAVATIRKPSIIII